MIIRPLQYQDPFQTTTILEFEKFINREQIVERILGKIRTGGHTAIIGSRRIGKSSLLRYLTFPGTRRLYKARYNFENYIILYLDPQDNLINRPEDFANFVFKECKKWLESNGYSNQSKNIDKNLEPNLQNINEFIYRIKKNLQLSLVVLIDEFEYFCKGALLGEAFFKKLRALGDQQYILYVTSSNKTLEELTRELKIAGSEFWNIFTNDFIGLFSKRDIETLIDQYLAISDTITFTNSDKEFVINRIGLHPYFVQRACGKIYSARYHNPNAVPDYDHMYNELLQEEWQRLGAYFNSLNDYQRAFIFRFLSDPSSIDTYTDTTTPNIFQSAFITDRGCGDYEFFSPLFKDYLIKNLTENTSTKDKVAKKRSQSKSTKKTDIQPVGRLDETTDEISFIEQARSAAVHQLEVHYAEALSTRREDKNEADRHVERLKAAGMEDVAKTLADNYSLLLDKELEELQSVYTILSRKLTEADKGIVIERIINILAKGWPSLKDVQ